MYFIFCRLQFMCFFAKFLASSVALISPHTTTALTISSHFSSSHLT